jgi:hypothetical protein
MEQLVVTPLLRRVLAIAIGVAAVGLATVLLVIFLSANTLGFAQKCAGGYCWGYQLDQYAFSKRTVLTIMGSWGLRIRYELPKMQVERVNEDRWLATDRALYLNLRCKPFGDAGAAGTPVRLIYDFQRGELYVSSALQLWRLPDYQGGDPKKNWLTEGEFQRVLTRIEP